LPATRGPKDEGYLVIAGSIPALPHGFACTYVDVESRTAPPRKRERDPWTDRPPGNGTWHSARKGGE
jgi:hypothetical protein